MDGNDYARRAADALDGIFTRVASVNDRVQAAQAYAVLALVEEVRALRRALEGR